MCYVHAKIPIMARLHVAQIITKLEAGAVQQNTLYSISQLNRTLFDVSLIAGPGGALDDEASELPDVTLRFCGELSRSIRPAADFEAYESLRSLLRELRPDIVHTHGYKAGIVGRMAASAEKIPAIVHTYHSFGFHRYQSPGVFRLSVALEREACRRSHHLIFNALENWEWAEELDLLQDCGVSLIRTGVDIEPLLQGHRSDAFREEFNIPRKAKVVGMLASLKPQKDPQTFVEIADLVSRKNQKVKFLLFGDGELAGAVNDRAVKMRYPNTFLYAGWRKDVSRILANLDLVVLPSLWEGLPRVLAEATIAGVPVVASDVGGNREIVFEGRNGVLAEPRNAEDFAEKVIRALEEDWKVDPELSRQIQLEYDIREMLRQEEAIYLKLRTDSSPSR
jgi:glycosyltransferase involved in cell wall biosynthesis